MSKPKHIQDKEEDRRQIERELARGDDPMEVNRRRAFFTPEFVDHIRKHGWMRVGKNGKWRKISRDK
jgi:hypothetical protein